MRSPPVLPSDGQPQRARSGVPGRQPGRGLTLIELMVSISILAIIVTAAVPAFDAIVLSSRLNSYSTDFVAAVQQARGEAIKRNRRVVVCVSTNGESCTTGGWQQGWLAFEDADADGVVDTGEQIFLIRQPLADGYRFTNGSATALVAFDGSGTASASVSLKLCRATPSVGSQDRQVDLSLSGRAVVTRTATGSCS